MLRGQKKMWIVAALSMAAFSATLGAGAASAETVWLCQPGENPNPCRTSNRTTYVTSSGNSTVRTPPLATKPKVDCFYVYPTVSGQEGPNSDRKIEAEQRAIARFQASRFSETCRVYAPVYRQLTLSSIGNPDDVNVENARVAYNSVRDAWRDYLKNFNNGRGVVLVGHSQGTYMLTALLRREIEPRPRVQEHLVSAVLLGGNVTVKKGRTLGGSFRKTPTCTDANQIRCVVAYSIYNETPPDDTLFGAPPTNSRFNSSLDIPAGPGLEVVCTNPAALGGGSAALDTLTRTEPFPGTLGIGLLILYDGEPPSAKTPWIQPRDHYRGRCVRENNAHVLKISSIAGARKLKPSPDATWGLHLGDVNLPLGNLVSLVRKQSQSYLKATQ